MAKKHIKCVNEQHHPSQDHYKIIPWSSFCCYYLDVLFCQIQSVFLIVTKWTASKESFCKEFVVIILAAMVNKLLTQNTYPQAHFWRIHERRLLVQNGSQQTKLTKRESTRPIYIRLATISFGTQKTWQPETWQDSMFFSQPGIRAIFSTLWGDILTK